MHFHKERTAANIAALQRIVPARFTFAKKLRCHSQDAAASVTPSHGHILWTRRANSRSSLRLLNRHKLACPLGGCEHEPFQVLESQSPLPPRLGWTIRAENLLVLPAQVMLEAFLPTLRQVVSHSPAVGLHGVLDLPEREAVENSTDYPTYYPLIRALRWPLYVLCRAHLLPAHAYEKWIEAI